MSSNLSPFTGAPKVIKGGIVLIAPNTSAIQRIIVLQYNPDGLSRTLQVQGVGAASSHRSEALRLTGPPVETIKLDAEIDATDQLEVSDKTTIASGILTQLAALETIIYPPSSKLITNNGLAAIGTLQCAPMETALKLFIWNTNRIMTVRSIEF